MIHWSTTQKIGQLNHIPSDVKEESVRNSYSAQLENNTTDSLGLPRSAVQLELLVFVCNRKGMAKQIRWQIFQFFHARAVEKA